MSYDRSDELEYHTMIKLFTHPTFKQLEKDVNGFIEKVERYGGNIIDIKFQVADNMDNNIMVIYQEY